MSSRIGVAVFGFGRIGRVHSRSLIQSHRAQILYIIDALDEETRKTIASQEWNLVEEHGTKVLKPADGEKAMADKAVKAVMICAPTGYHVTLIELACKYKKQIFCEKPIALTVEETTNCYALAKSAGVTLFCGFNRRFDLAFSQMQKAVASGSIGKLQMMTGVGRDHPEPPDGYFAPNTGSFFIDCGIHFFDCIPWIAGEYPNQVMAMGHANKEGYKKNNDYSAIAFILKFPSGLIAHIDCCRYAPYGLDQRFEVIGDKGAIVAQNQRDNDLLVRTEGGDMSNPIKSDTVERYEKAYFNEMMNFLDVVQGITQCSISVESAVNGLKAALAAEESCKTGKLVDISY